MTAASQTEPAVLAETKEFLFDEEGYVVADTQFAQDRWLEETPIDEAIREELAPFNHVRVGSGYPDLVGVSSLSTEKIAVERLGEQPPLIAVEAKGETGHGVDLQRGIVQAYDRLHEANVVYASAPETSITPEARTLASELNVGLVGVREDGSKRIHERPRVVGGHSVKEASAIRFQAGAQGVADRSFGLNHPKNYLAVPIAVAADGAFRTLLADHVVGAVSDAVQGAAFLDLVEKGHEEPQLTQLGAEVVRFAMRSAPSLGAALETFEEWQRSRKRFIEVAPAWGELTRRVVSEYPATQLLVAELQTMYNEGFPGPSLVELVEWLHERYPTFTVELFLRGDESVRKRALSENGELRRAPLTEGDSYHSPTVFQLKAMLYHAGVLTERGREPSRLTPETDVWQLRNPLSRGLG